MPALLLIVACVLWGVSFPLIKALHLDQSARLPGVSSVFLSAWMQLARFGLGALMLASVLSRFGKITRGEWRQGGELALWGGVGMALQADGMAYTSASTSAFLTQAYCVILPLWACLKFKKLPAARIVVAVGLVMAGGAILAGVRPGNLRLGRGEIETLLAACVFTLQILALEKPVYAGNRGLPVTFVMFAGIAVIFLPVSWALAPSASAMLTAGASWPAFGILVALAFFCSVGAYLLMNTFQPRVTSTEAGLIYTIEPVFTSVFALVLPAWLGVLIGRDYPNETITRSLLVGGGLILAANVLVIWKPRRA
jgi:drug/metabolite transporter (DMT)-like permease